MTQRQANIAVIGAKDDPRIKQLEKLPDGANVVCVGSVEDLIGKSYNWKGIPKTPRVLTKTP